MDEIHLEYLAVVGLPWLTRLCSIMWHFGTVPLEWQIKGDWTEGSDYRGNHTFSLRGKVYFSVLERRIQLIVGPWFQEEQCLFHPGSGKLD